MLEKECHSSIQQCVDIACNTLIVYKFVFYRSFETRHPEQALRIEIEITPEQNCCCVI